MTISKDELRQVLVRLLPLYRGGHVPIRLQPADPGGPVVDGTASLCAVVDGWDRGTDPCSRVLLEFDGCVPAAEADELDDEVIPRIEIRHPSGGWHTADWYLR